MLDLAKVLRLPQNLIIFLRSQGLKQSLDFKLPQTHWHGGPCKTFKRTNRAGPLVISGNCLFAFNLLHSAQNCIAIPWVMKLGSPIHLNCAESSAAQNSSQNIKHGWHEPTAPDNYPTIAICRDFRAFYCARVKLAAPSKNRRTIGKFCGFCRTVWTDHIGNPTLRCQQPTRWF